MSTNYGHAPGIRFNLVVNYFVFRALTGRPLTVYGDGGNWRPFIHVRDARALKDPALRLETWSHPIYNVGANDQNYRIKTIAELVQDELDADFEITYREDEHPGPSYHVNFDRLAYAGFVLEHTLREGVRTLVEQFTDASQIPTTSPSMQ